MRRLVKIQPVVIALALFLTTPSSSRIVATGSVREPASAHPDFRGASIAQAASHPDTAGEDTPQDFSTAVEEAGSKTLAEAIIYLRDLLLGKSKPLPAEVAQKLAPYFDRHILEKARYSTEWVESSGATLRYFLPTDQYSMAITLDHVIVLLDENDLDNLWLWAHELKHVEQYQRLGVEPFARLYLQDHQVLEQEADDHARHVVQKIRQNRKGAASSSGDSPQESPH